MQQVDLETAKALINFSGVQGQLSENLANQQLKGAVALHNMLALKGVAYLADEVGMGKTYIALGVVALMRRFNPQLRVLYLLPKNNVRDKWVKDYKSFVEQNYKLCDFTVKGLGHSPSVRYAISRNLPEFINAIATDSARDHYICTSAFSFSLGNSSDELKVSLSQFAKLLPQNKTRAEKLINKIDTVTSGKSLMDIKHEIKECWASALYSIMPRFDLVVVDEAHNLKKGRDSSDRNQLLAMLMGSDLDYSQRKAERVLFLSATPYDRDLEQLRNQFSLFGMEAVITLDNKASKSDVNEMLKKIMVRRLNEIVINGQPHTRNMYRYEYRSGKNAEIELKIEQQLFAALLQKKVSESLNENCSGKFELGMLSSFESYLPGEKGKPVEFDGQDDHASQATSERDAQDRTVVQCLVEDYFKEFHEKPPHPKMDSVAITASRSAFKEGKKQLIFVRRVRSVTELKSKIEYEYDKWIGRYLEIDSAVTYWFKHYQNLKPPIDGSIVDDADSEGEGESTPSSFFTWFYRGTNGELVAGKPVSDNKEHHLVDLVTLPFNFRNMLSNRSMMFEINWAILPGMPHLEHLDIDWTCGVNQNVKDSTAQLRFRHLQYAYLTAACNSKDKSIRTVAQRIRNLAFADFKPALNLSEYQDLDIELLRPTILDRIARSDILHSLFPHLDEKLFSGLAGDDSSAAETHLKRVIIHQELIGVVCRIDHPFIDLYSLRNLCIENGKISAEQNDNNLINGFINILIKQVGSSFSSYKILKDIAENLDILIKLNFEEAYRKQVRELTRYLSNQLSPLSPVVGATGENSHGRSPMARKFRMPGYPCVLVSTDVFQEGEDLHTFCDSVIHYGISASPIALEQKIGRVDRIGSQSHRAIGAAKDNHAQHFIQVTYPHIPQSLEYFQVRQAASNLNEFHRTLHELMTHPDAHNTAVVLKDHLLDESAIPPQILDLLKSPYDVQIQDLQGENYVDLLIKQQRDLDARLLYAKDRIEACFSDAIGEQFNLTESILGLIGKTEGIDILIKSSQGWPELLLSLTMTDNKQFDFDFVSEIERINYLRLLQSDEKFRYQLIVDKQKKYLMRNVEVYVGAENILSDFEVRDALERIDYEHYQCEKFASNSQVDVGSMVSKLCVDNSSLRISESQSGILIYDFKLEGRKQLIAWMVKNKHVLVTSIVISTAETIELAKNKELLLNATLRRNSVFDVVDFFINEQMQLSVKAIYPLFHLNLEELEFVFSSVAREADRLQYILRAGGDEDV